jgi:hypothetical protein
MSDGLRRTIWSDSCIVRIRTLVWNHHGVIRNQRGICHAD